MEYTLAISPWKPRYEYVLMNGTVYVRDTKTSHGAGMISAIADRPFEKSHVPNSVLRAKLEAYEREIQRHKLVDRLRLFLERGAGRVPPLDIAWVASELAAVDLDIPCPRVEIGLAEEARRLGAWGWTHPEANIIFVKEGICLCAAVITAAHESRHRAQYINGHTVNRESDERDARNYEWSFVRRYLAGVHCSECGRSVEDQAA